MKNIFTTTLLLLTILPLKAQYNEGSLGFGFFVACPQHELKDINYDDGYGMNISYLSQRFGKSAPLSFQWGVRMDISSMDRRKFNPIDINTPVPDMGELEVKNSMYGFFGTGRLNFGPGPFTPYVEILVGHRNFNTKQTITAMNPDLNPEYESYTLYDKVVHTKRFHYGGSVGFTYRIGSGFYLETAVTYTEGNKGAVMPLQDITQEGNFLNYPHVSSPTDMLLINAGIRFRLRSKSKTNSTSSTRPTTTPTNTRYKTKESTPPTSTKPKTSDSPKTSTPEKKKLEVKPSTKPKKNGSGKS